MDLNTFIDVIGWIGAACLLSGYILASRKSGASDTILFHGLNFIGAMFFAANGYYHGAIPVFVLNVIWLFFGVYAVHRICRKPKPAS